jgi:hypothetical protein
MPTVKIPCAFRKTHLGPGKPKLPNSAEKGPEVSRDATTGGTNNPISARELRKTAKIQGLPKRRGGATVTLHLTWTV